MHTLRLLWCLLFLGSLARAHDVYPHGPLTIPRGQEQTFFIIADVMEENATAYSFVNNTDSTVASVAQPFNFKQKLFGAWRIKGLKVGTATLSFRWIYKKDASGNEGDRVETVVVNVVPPDSRSAANQWALTVADPVNSRGGEYTDVWRGFALGGPMPLGFGLHYSSAFVAEGIEVGVFGVNRRHNFEAALEVEETGLVVKVTTARGREVRFERRTVGSKWTQSGRVDEVFGLMEEEGLFYFFKPAAQGVMVFDAEGKLTRILDGRGNTHTLTYAGALLTQVADGLGRTLAFTHTSGRLTRVTDHTGRHIDFTYTAANMATAADAAAKATSFAYNGAGLLTAFMRPEGNTPFTQTYSGGKVTSQTERGTDTTLIAYAAGETTITQPGGPTMQHRYSATGDLTGYTDEDGRDIAMTSDATGRRNGVRDREGDATGITFHAPSGLPATITNAEGRTTTMIYKPRLLKLDGVADKSKALVFWDLGKITFADGTSETFTYDARGNLLTRIDRAGKKWTATFNERGQPLTKTNPTKGVETMTYDAAANLLSWKDSGTGAETYAYDAQNRLTTITRPGGATATFAYDARDLLESATDERGKTTLFTYDDNGRLETVKDADTNTTTLAYDTLDRVESVTDRLGKMSARTFDARRLLASVTDRNGNTTNFAYDARQRLDTITDAGNQQWHFGYDDEGLLTFADNPVDPGASSTRNALGQVLTARNPLGQVERVERDAMQRITRRFDPLGRGTAWTYDKRGDLVGTSEEGGGVGKFTRDALGQVTALTAPNGGVWKSAFTPEGRMASMTDPLGKTWVRTYDTRGRLAGIAFPDAATAQLSYDGASNLTRMLFADGTDFNFTYDNLNRPASATDADTAGSALAFTYDAEGRLTGSQQDGVNFGATYDDDGRLTTVSYHGGAIVVTYAYDTRNRLTTVSDGTGASVIFTYDDAGRPLTITRGNGRNSTLTYDAASRLTRIQHGVEIDLKYTRNAAGEITAEDRTVLNPFVVAVGTETFAFGKAGEPVGAGITHDARGRRTGYDGRTLLWDDADRLIALDTTSLRYNALGDILTRGALGATTRFFPHHAITGSPIVSERAEGTMIVTRYYVYTPGGRLLYAIDALAGNAAVYFHFDQIGSTLALSGAGGTITDTYTYGPYGEDAQHTGPNSQPFTWLGQLGVRQEGPLFHMRARYYDPRTATFVSRDPLPPRLDDVKSLNPYAYANQNPLRYVDPRGAMAVDARNGWNDKRVNEGYGEFNNLFVNILAIPICHADFYNDEIKERKQKERAAANPPAPAAPPAVAKRHGDPAIVAATIKKIAAGHSAAAAMVADAISYSLTQDINAGLLEPMAFGSTAPSSAPIIISQTMRAIGPISQPSRPVKIADNDSPLPRDRLIFNFTFYDTIVSTPQSGGALQRAIFGFEKTFLDGDASFGLRLPFSADPADPSMGQNNDFLNFLR